MKIYFLTNFPGVASLFFEKWKKMKNFQVRMPKIIRDSDFRQKKHHILVKNTIFPFKIAIFLSSFSKKYSFFSGFSVVVQPNQGVQLRLTVLNSFLNM